jgi:hypothetical protein
MPLQQPRIQGRKLLESTQESVRLAVAVELFRKPSRARADHSGLEASVRVERTKLLVEAALGAAARSRSLEEQYAMALSVIFDHATLARAVT